MKKRCIDIEGKIINHVPEYWVAVDAIQNYLAALERDDIDRSDILVCCHLLMREAEFHWRFKTGPVVPWGLDESNKECFPAS